MSRIALEDQDSNLVRQAIEDPSSVALNEEQTFMLQRYLSVARVLDNHPTINVAVKVHMAKYPEISQALAYRDIHATMKIYNTKHTFDFPFWHNWLLNEATRQIEAAKINNDIKGWNMGINSLIKLVGEQPETETDPKLLEKHTFVIQINHNNTILNLSLEDMRKLPLELREKITGQMYQEIDDQEAIEIMES